MTTVDDTRKLIEELRKKHGESSVLRMGDGVISRPPVIPTGSVSLNAALGIGGYPRGRITEIFGPEASGKTTLTLHAIAEAQRDGGTAAFIDAEHALDPTYATALGVQVNDLLLSQPDSGEQALNICETMVGSGLVDIIVVDSVAALVPQSELSGEMGASHPGAQARLMSQALRKLTATLARNVVALVFVNQLRHKIGVMFGSPETTPGGQALRYYASIRLDVRRRQHIKEGENPVGNQMLIKVVKNKFYPPFKTTELDIIWGRGIDKLGDLLSSAVQVGVVAKSGAWYSFNGERVGHGLVKAVKVLEGNPQLVAEISKQVTEKLL